MALDKKEIALTVGGILAGLTLTYLLYRRQQQDSANAQTDNANAISEAASYYPAPATAVQTITVPTITATPSPTDETNQSHVSAIDPTLEALLTSALSADNTSVTAHQTPLATITALQVPTTYSIPEVQIPALIDYSQSQSSSLNARPIVTQGI